MEFYSSSDKLNRKMVVLAFIFHDNKDRLTPLQ